MIEILIFVLHTGDSPTNNEKPPKEEERVSTSSGRRSTVNPETLKLLVKRVKEWKVRQHIRIRGDAFAHKMFCLQ